MKALITGSSGFVGKHLREYLEKEKIKVIGVDLPDDITDPVLVDDLIYKEKPDYIFHLAAKAFVPTSFHAPQEVLYNNIIPAVNIFESVRKYGLSTKILVAGSSEQYGLVKEYDIPIKETNSFNPRSPYAISKISMELLAKWYVDTYNLNIYLSRAFNHEGYGRGEQYVISTFAKQIVEIENGKDPVIRVGNLEAERDFTDVRDMVRAYKMLVDKGEKGKPYNICSGKCYKISHILAMLVELSKSKSDIAIEVDQSRIRPSEVPLLLGDCTEFKKLGWKLKYGIKETLKENLRYWREQYK